MTVAQPLFGFIIIAAFVAMLGALMVLPAPAETSSVQLINTFMGLLAGMAASVVSFYFGSSTQSKTKDDTINTLAAGGGTGNGAAPKPGGVDVTGTVKVTEPKGETP